MDVVVEFEHPGLQSEHGDFGADHGDDARKRTQDGKFCSEGTGDQVARTTQGAHQGMLFHAGLVARLYRRDENQRACPQHQAENQLDRAGNPIDDAFDLGDDRVHLEYGNGRMRRKELVEEPLAVGLEMETRHVRCRESRQRRTREDDKEVRLQAVPLDPAQIRHTRRHRQSPDIELQHVAYAQPVPPRVVRFDRNQCFGRIGGPPVALYQHVVAGQVIGPRQVPLGTQARSHILTPLALALAPTTGRLAVDGEDAATNHRKQAAVVVRMLTQQVLHRAYFVGGDIDQEVIRRVLGYLGPPFGE